MKKKIKNIVIIAVATLLTVCFTTLGVLYVLERKAAMQEVATDVSWYDENGTEFIITTAEELYGLATLSEKYDFKGQTIKLGADIVINKGNASDWDKNTPANRWLPIKGYAGTFDGQGHSISGLFARGSNANLGLFTETMPTCDIKNFKILNSYFRVNGNFPIGSVSANGSGKFSQIYSDAIMVSDGEYCGGLIGALNVGGGSAALGQSSKILNCWFDGEVRLTSKDSRHGGGIVGSMRGGTADILHCLNTGCITNKNEKIRGNRIGGIVGGVDYVNNSGTLRMEDCLNVGTIKGGSDSHVGSVIGTVGSTAVKIALRNVYATAESAARTIGYSNTGVTGSVRILSTEHVKGKDWYSWSSLEFDSQWTVTETDTPVLQCFADKIPSVKGLKKAYDISWYNNLETSFVLKTKEQLIGFSILSTDNTFEGMTIRLGADITMNEGTGEEWLKKTPAYIWIPIGNGLTAETGFCGNFDGQGHTISGLFTRNSEQGIGLFKTIGNNATIRNLRITNSYFEYIGDYETSAYMGSVAGRSYGNLDTIYSDVTLVSSGQVNGGMLGHVLTSGFCTVNNCWYDGELRMVGSSKNGGRMGGGIIGRIESGQTTISHCLMSGHVSSEAIDTGVHIGGFVGYIRYTKKNEGVKLNITDSLMSGKVHAQYISCVGMIVGRVFEEVTATFTNTYAIQGNAVVETKDSVTYVNTVSRIDDTGVVKGGCIKKSKEQLSGYNGYIWTLLDFDKFWSVVTAGNGRKAGTPVLKSFAENTPSLAGKTRMIDIKWYDASKKSYTISNIRELYGFSELAGGTTNFEGKTVKLGADITVNKGNAADWKKKTPTYIWLPIGAEVNETQSFCGIFDGQGHTISGLYHKTKETGVGLFKAIGPDSVVKNLRLTNSYFEYVSEKRNTAAAGAIVGRGYGDVDTVYSDAIVRSGGIGNGGMVGQMYGDKDTKINNCWYAGLIEMVGTNNNDGGQHAGGMVGRIECGAISVTHCLFSGKMTCEADKAAAHMGGMVGYIRYVKKDDGSKLDIRDCLVTGTSHIVWNSCAGSVLGRICADLTATIDKTYVVENSLVITREGKTSYGTLVGYKEGKLVGGAIEKTKEQLTGNNGYMFTELDFDKYWAVTSDSTPVLQSFASSVPSVTGLTKMVDTSWYKTEQKSYTLNTAAQLYGLADIVRGTDNFADKTVKLGADITINAGSVAQWEKNGFQGLMKWVPIGTASYAFRGNFDGQGHTISGLYMNGTGAQALFARAYGDNITLKNFSMKNTYIKSTDGSNGSVAAVFHGNMEHIYSEANIVIEGAKDNARYNTGGFAGWLNGYDTNFSHCWFDGSITCNGQAVGGIYGVQYYTHVVTIDHCLVTATLETTTSLASQILGGFAGSVHGNFAGKDLVPKLIIKNSVFEGTLKTRAKNANMTGSTVGQVSTSNPEGGLWIENSWFTQSNGKYVIGWQADKATVTNDGGKTKYTGSCSALNGILGKDVAEITTLNKKLGLKDKIWCDTIEGIALKEFVGARELIDVSWYNEKKDTYTIETKAQLYGFSRLNEANENAFKGKTVQLGKDITVNSGTVAEWKENSFEGVLRWQPIGIVNTFNGNFDGKGHTISGLYMKGSSYQALFAKAYGEEDDVINIGNFDLENTYIESTGSYNGSIAGKFSGNLTSVYSDAEIHMKTANNHTNWYHTGGLVGYVDNQDTTIANCWYAGTLTTNGSSAGGVLGYYGTDTELTIENCLVNGTLITNVPSGNASLGGFVGKVYSEDAKTITINNSLCTADVVKGEGVTPTHFGQLLGQVFAKNCNINVNKAYYPENTSAIGWVDGNSITLNNTTYTTGKHTANAQANNTLKNACAKWTKNSTVANLNLDATTWKDNGAGSQVLLLNGHENGLVRLDIMWYKKNNNTYTLYTKEELYGLSYLTNHRPAGVFTGKTIKLGTDIHVNTGNVPERAASGDHQLIKWQPIGTTNAFTGNFNGQGYTISGLYMKGAGNQSLFGAAYRTDGVINIGNFDLKNTYIQSNMSYNGSIAGKFGGNLTSVYSDATIQLEVGASHTSDYRTGGMIGYVENQNTIIENCWYAGNLTTNAACVGGMVGRYDKKVSLTIENCLVSGIMTTNIPTNSSGFVNAGFGGFIGRVGSANAKIVKISNSLITGSVTQGPLSAQGDKNRAYIGQFIGEISAPNCEFHITKSYCPNTATTDPIGYATPSSLKVNNISYPKAGNGASVNAQVNADLRAQCKIWTDASTVSSLKLNTMLWKDNGAGSQVLLLNGHENGLVRLDITWYDASSDTYTLYTKGQLYGFSYLSNTRTADIFTGKTVQLGAEISMNEGTVAEWEKNSFSNLIKWKPIGSPQKPFKGSFDGRGNYISGLYMDEASHVGLFSAVTGGTIQNLGLKNSYISSTGNATGSIVGEFKEGTMSCVYSDATISSKYWGTGGLVGRVEDDTTTKDFEQKFEQCQFAGTINTTATQAGGIFGYCGTVKTGLITIKDCLVTGDIIVTKTDAIIQGVGGLVGSVTNNQGTQKLIIETSIFDGSYTLNHGANNWSQCGLLVGTVNTASGGGVTLTDTYAVGVGYTVNTSGSKTPSQDMFGALQSSAKLTAVIKGETVLEQTGKGSDNGFCRGLDAPCYVQGGTCTVSGCNLQTGSEEIWIDISGGVALNVFEKLVQ